MTNPFGTMPMPYNGENPFKPQVVEQYTNPYEPGTPLWWLDRLIQKLMDRQERFDVLESYALGHHPLPNCDYRYVRALKELQAKARTNYCELVIRATTERMKVKSFRFGPVGTADDDAAAIWDYNEMDMQSPMALNLAATFGVVYALVSPADPEEENSEPSVCIEDPRMCVVERDPYKLTNHPLAGLKLWQDDTIEQVMAVLYLPDYVYTFTAKSHATTINETDAFLTNRTLIRADAAGFELQLIQDNPLGRVPLVEGVWQPSWGALSRAEHEGVLDIQDRINHTVLDRLIIAKSQAYRQRWATGVNIPERKGTKAPPWDPGADMIWVTADPDANFGDFESADIVQLLKAVQDDISDMAAITQTPASYLMNRVVNVSGDALIQAQSALVNKVRNRSEAMGHFYELVMRTCFLYKDDARAKGRHADVVWFDPEIRTMAEMADAAGKYIAAGIPLQLIMERANFTPDEIAFAIEERDRLLAEQAKREDEVASRDTENAIAQEKAKPKPASSK